LMCASIASRVRPAALLRVGGGRGLS
jgi:hypothetical protein